MRRQGRNRKIRVTFVAMMKQLLRSPLFLAAAIVTLAASFLLLYNESTAAGAVGGLFFSSVYQVSGLMLLMLVFGCGIAKTLEHEMDSYPQGREAGTIAGCLAGIVGSLAVTCACFLEGMMMMLIVPPFTWELFVYVTKYVALNYLFPLIASTFIGMMIGLRASRRGMFILVIPVWLVVSPLAAKVAFYLAAFVQADCQWAMYPFATLNLARPLSFELAQAYGVPFQSSAWLIPLGKVLFVCLSCLAILLCRGKRAHRACTIGFFLVLAVVIGCTANEQSLFA